MTEKELKNERDLDNELEGIIVWIISGIYMTVVNMILRKTDKGQYYKKEREIREYSLQQIKRAVRDYDNRERTTK